MATLSQRIEALEKLIADLTPIAPVQFIVLDIGRDAPEEYERKKNRLQRLKQRVKELLFMMLLMRG